VSVLLTWNVAGRVARLAEQAAMVAGERPDLVALQEVTPRSAPVWLEALASQGLRAVAAGLSLDTPLAGRRPLGVLIGACGDLDSIPIPAVPWPERLAAARAVLDGIPVDVLAVHAPISQREDQVKVRTLEAVHAALIGPSPRPGLLLGDLNTPRREHPDGRVWTFARTSSGALRPERGERHDRAELGVLAAGLAPAGWVDAWRAVHGPGAREVSWTWPRGRGGYRVDHVLVRGGRVLRAEYRHDWRASGLSDHSGLVVEVDFSGP
jgi:endonuclease/exonuclease/phosphatase family metal-dependent hydrolase